MVEHVGAVQIDGLRADPGAGCSSRAGACSTTAITRLRHTDAEAGAFSERYVFPDAAPLHLSRILLALERAGFVTHHVEDFAPRLRRDAAPLGRATSTPTSSEATRLAGPERIRVWRLYLRAARNGFESGFTSIYQARCSLA